MYDLVLQPVAVAIGHVPVRGGDVHDGLGQRPVHLRHHHRTLLLHLLQETRCVVADFADFLTQLCGFSIIDSSLFLSAFCYSVEYFRNI